VAGRQLTGFTKRKVNPKVQPRSDAGRPNVVQILTAQQWPVSMKPPAEFVIVRTSWEILKGGGWPRQGDWVAANAVTARLMLGEIEAAETLLQETLALCGRTPILLRAAAARTIPDLWDAITSALDRFTESDCLNYFAEAGYDAF